MKVVQVLKVLSWVFIILVLLLSILVGASFYMGSEAATVGLEGNPESSIDTVTEPPEPRDNQAIVQ